MTVAPVYIAHLLRVSPMRLSRPLSYGGFTQYGYLAQYVLPPSESISVTCCKYCTAQQPGRGKAVIHAVSGSWKNTYCDAFLAITPRLQALSLRYFETAEADYLITFKAYHVSAICSGFMECCERDCSYHSVCSVLH